jgi:hypothetical protein
MKTMTDADLGRVSETEDTATPEGTTSAVGKKKVRVKKAAAPKPAADAVAAASSKDEEKKKKDKHKDKDKDKKKKKEKEVVLVRFEREQLAEINARADSLGLSRAAWLRMTVSQVLANS